MTETRCRKTSRAATTPEQLIAVDERDVAEAADRHLVDRDRDRVTPPQDDRISGHRISHDDTVELTPRELEDRVALGEDPGQPTAFGHDEAVDAPAVHEVDRLIGRRPGVDEQRLADAQCLERRGEGRAAEPLGLRRDVDGPQVGSAVSAVVLALEVLGIARRAGDRAGHHATVQVSPDRRSFSRSPSPRCATASLSWAVMSSSWVGRVI